MRKQRRAKFFICLAIVLAVISGSVIGGYFIIENLTIKVYNSIVSTEKHNQEIGIIVGIHKDRFDISCGNGTVISILELQLPSKNKMLARDFINGQGKKILALGKKIGE